MYEHYNTRIEATSLFTKQKQYFKLHPKNAEDMSLSRRIKDVLRNITGNYNW